MDIQSSFEEVTVVEKQGVGSCFKAYGAVSILIISIISLIYIQQSIRRWTEDARLSCKKVDVVILAKLAWIG